MGQEHPVQQWTIEAALCGCVVTRAGLSRVFYYYYNRRIEPGVQADLARGGNLDMVQKEITRTLSSPLDIAITYQIVYLPLNDKDYNVTSQVMRVSSKWKNK